ncbi:MAG: FISUMP domain-containing protein [Bacteroidota bacterium]|nr:FISUMP domain-containing protein [Bacteroidota bacterium]
MKKFLILVLVSIISRCLYSQTFNCGDTLIDIRDGQKYPTVQIGTACWMKKNLNYGTTVNSYSSTSFHSDMLNNSVVEKYAYNNDVTKLATYGGLYEWNELMNYTTAPGGQGICPNGWHVPTDAEWQTMIAAAGGTLITPNGGYGGNKLKNVGEGFGAGAGTNTSGFSAKHSGDRDSYGIFYGLTLRSIFWTSTTNGSAAWQYTLWAEKDTIFRGGNAHKETGLACRCVKDATSSIDKYDLKHNLNVFPNPTSNNIQIVISDYKGDLNFVIKDIYGKVLIQENSSTISIKELPSGIYFLEALHANSGELIGLRKIIKN